MRIRTIKPEFFKHEELFDAEKSTGLPIRIAYTGLWCAADREGRFKWRPRQLGADILPYDQIDFSRVLDALTTRGFIMKYRVGDECFGFIPSFKRHQVINNRERDSEIPEFQPILCVSKDIDALVTREPRVSHASKAEGKGREENKEGKGREDSSASPLPSSEHTAFIDGWVQNFKAQFGLDYSFDGGRDGKAVRELLRMGIQRIDLLEIAKSAWKRGMKTPKSFNCEQASTIHGFKGYFNQIRVELNGKNGHVAPEQNQLPEQITIKTL